MPYKDIIDSDNFILVNMEGKTEWGALMGIQDCPYQECPSIRVCNGLE